MEVFGRDLLLSFGTARKGIDLGKCSAEIRYQCGVRGVPMGGNPAAWNRTVRIFIPAWVWSKAKSCEGFPD